MRDAVKQGDELAAPTVGRWRPAVGLGHPVASGLVIGEVVRLGRGVPVRLPDGVSGAVVQCAPAGQWVQHGDVLMTVGAALVGEGADDAAPALSSAAGPEGCTAVVADTDGTIYLTPEPDAPPFAPVGATVKKQATLALVEVMKTFTPVRAPHDGEVVRVDTSTGAAVEAGAPLFWIRPTPR